jgi:hypothetical protein
VGRSDGAWVLTVLAWRLLRDWDGGLERTEGFSQSLRCFSLALLLDMGPKKSMVFGITAHGSFKDDSSHKASFDYVEVAPHCSGIECYLLIVEAEAPCF